MQQINLHIATPCHENWNAMTPTETGKFCASCSKQVIDFTLLSDAQILQFLARNRGPLCGRFDAGQLARPLVEPTLSKRKSWYLAFALPFSLLFQKAFGQSKERMVGKLAVKVEQKQQVVQDIVMGTPLPPLLPEWVTLHGTLRDEKGNAVENALVTAKSATQSCITDSAGRFSIKLLSGEDSVVLMASSIGYQPIERKVRLREAANELVLTLTTAEAVLEGVAVTSYSGISCGRVAGGISIYHTITYAEKRDSTVRKLFHLNPFTVYPNPARSGSYLQINCKKAGTYEVQLLSGASALLKMENVQVSSDGATVTFQLPPLLATGIYYLRLVNVDKKRSYLEKILVN